MATACDCSTTPSTTDIVCGDTLTVEFCFRNEDGTAWGDIQGWQLWITFRKVQKDSVPSLVVKYEVPSGDLACEGKAIVTVKSTETEQLTPGKWHYEYKRVLPGTPPNVWTIEHGERTVIHGTKVSEYL